MAVPSPPSAEQHARAARLAVLELVRADKLGMGAGVAISRKGFDEFSFTASRDDAGAWSIGGEALDARALSAGHWSLVDEAGQHEAVVETRGKSGIDVVMAGQRIPLKWKAETGDA